MVLKSWIKAARLRTLPLTLVSIGVGGALAHMESAFSAVVFGFTILTTLILQILSNFANDYGDFVKGTDNDNRVGPARAMQSGQITRPQMLAGLWVSAFLAFVSGVALLYVSLETLEQWLVFLTLGLFSIAAAVTYTVGKKAYGYSGLGDIMVFIFFGWVGVFGSYYLHTGHIDLWVLLPASSVGMFSAGVLNMNNLRDTENDLASGKITVAVHLGIRGSKIYQTVLVKTGLWATFIYLFHVQKVQLVWVFIPAILLFTWHLISVWKERSYSAFDKQLKICVLSTLVYGITFMFIAWLG